MGAKKRKVCLPAWDLGADVLWLAVEVPTHGGVGLGRPTRLGPLTLNCNCL